MERREIRRKKGENNGGKGDEDQFQRDTGKAKHSNGGNGDDGSGSEGINNDGSYSDVSDIKEVIEGY